MVKSLRSIFYVIKHLVWALENLQEINTIFYIFFLKTDFNFWFILIRTFCIEE